MQIFHQIIYSCGHTTQGAGLEKDLKSTKLCKMCRSAKKTIFYTCGHQKEVGGLKDNMKSDKPCKKCREAQSHAKYLEALRANGKRLATATYCGCGHKIEVVVSIRHRGGVVRLGSCPTCNIVYNFHGGVGDASEIEEDDE